MPLRAPNDLTLAAAGFYFTDPGGSREAPIGTVHYVDNAGRMHLVASGLRVPNGLVGSPDGRTLYVAETVLNRVLWFSIKPDGTLGPINILCELPARVGVQAAPDGLAVDSEGNVYVAHLGMSSVQVIAPSGKLIRTLPAGNSDASNLVFGGPRMSDLYITGSVGHRSNSPGRVFRATLSEVTGVSSLPTREHE
jgi:gluconolactonase